MTNDFFQLGTDGHIAHLQLNRPERLNTLAPAFFPALRSGGGSAFASTPGPALGDPLSAT